jgi:NADH:ubiquinone oxidoreductase subunit H
MFFISRLADINRAPFNILELEVKSFVGYNVEYAQNAILTRWRKPMSRDLRISALTSMSLM